MCNLRVDHQNRLFDHFNRPVGHLHCGQVMNQYGLPQNQYVRGNVIYDQFTNHVVGSIQQIPNLTPPYHP